MAACRGLTSASQWCSVLKRQTEKLKYAQDTITMAHKGHLQAAKLISDLEEKEACRKDALFDTEKSARHTAETEAAALKGQLQALERQQQRQQQLEAARQAEATSTHAAQVCLHPTAPALHPAAFSLQVLTLEKQQQVLEAKLVQKTEELQAATAQKAELAEQVQALTNSVEEVEEQCVLAIRASDQKLRRLQDAHAREVAALYRQLANFWQEASKALSVIKFPNLDMAAGDKTKHLTKKSAEEVPHAGIAEAQLASNRQKSADATAKISVTGVDTPANDMIQRLTKKTAKAGEQGCAGLRTELAQQRGRAQQMQAEPQSQAEQMTVLKLKQKSAEHEASNVQAPKEGLMIKAGVPQELHSLSPAPSTAAASPSAASGSRGSGGGGSSLTQAPQPTLVPLPFELNRDGAAPGQCLRVEMGHPPAHLTDQWVFRAHGVHRGPITKAALLGFLRRKQLPPGTPVLHYPEPAEGPRQPWFLVDCAQARTVCPEAASRKPEDYAVVWDEHAAWEAGQL
ncbi:hypothetical protein ABBQ32_011547 [Trebouxia sp. C0010 RCD-2024]